MAFESEVRLNFDEIQRRLFDTLRQRVRNGELTERGVARSAGISQPHIHNVLKGVKNLSPELIDLILKSLDCSVLTLFTPVELRRQLERCYAVAEPTFDIPFICNAVGPGRRWTAMVDSQAHNPVPCRVGGLGQSLVLARLSPDTDMQQSIAGNNIAALDTSEFMGYCPDSVYVGDRGRDAVLRHIRPGLRRVYLAADADLADPSRWEVIATPRGPASVVRARVCWLGKEADMPGMAAA